MSSVSDGQEITADNAPADSCPHCGRNERTEELICVNCKVEMCHLCASFIEGMVLCHRCADDLFFAIALAGFI